MPKTFISSVKKNTKYWRKLTKLLGNFGPFLFSMMIFGNDFINIKPVIEQIFERNTHQTIYRIKVKMKCKF